MSEARDGEAVNFTPISRIILASIYCTGIGGAVVFLIFSLPVAVLHDFTILFFSPAAFIVAVYFALPVFPIAFAVNIFLDRKNIKNRYAFIMVAVIVASSYGFVLYYFFNGQDVFPYVFGLGGFFSSWAYWNDVYGEKRRFRFL